MRQGFGYSDDPWPLFVEHDPVPQVYADHDPRPAINVPDRAPSPVIDAEYKEPV